MTLNSLQNPTIDCTSGPWQTLNPWSVQSDPALKKIAAYLNKKTTQDMLANCERQRQYPQDIRQELQNRGLASFFADPASKAKGSKSASQVTFPHIFALNAMSTAASASLGITLGVNGLALLPIYIAASDQQLAWIGQRIHQGSFLSLLLTEIKNGSNLLANESIAAPGLLNDQGSFTPQPDNDDVDQVPSHYCLSGRKDLINGGQQHQLLVVLARSKKSPAPNNLLSARNHFSFFLVDRGKPAELKATSSPYRWLTQPVPAADISSVCFDNLVLPVSRRIGPDGQGFSIVQKTLSMSRGGVSALAVGLASRAVQLAIDYAKNRRIYDGPLLKLGAIAEHLMCMRAMELLISALSIKAIAAVNSQGVAGVHYAAAAKYACCAMAEDLVTEGRYLHGGRALLLDSAYQALLGDVLLFGTFDGTSHLVLDQLQWRLSQIAAQALPSQEESLTEIKTIYATEPQPLRQIAHFRNKTLLIHPVSHARALKEHAQWLPAEALAQLSETLLTLARSLRNSKDWDQDQGLRFELGRILAWVEMLIALVELADPGLRKALGLPPLSNTGPFPEMMLKFSFAWLGSRIAAALRSLIYQSDIQGDLSGLNQAEASLGRLYKTNRSKLIENPQLLTEVF